MIYSKSKSMYKNTIGLMKKAGYSSQEVILMNHQSKELKDIAYTAQKILHIEGFAQKFEDIWPVGFIVFQHLCGLTLVKIKVYQLVVTVVT
ncbi:MAG: hypothetical protein CM15mV51_1390 [uncultured marine virus]|nr:MAG: hypothetical protein CM15mV51_1390 [uncultured marine virus]